MPADAAQWRYGNTPSSTVAALDHGVSQDLGHSASMTAAEAVIPVSVIGGGAAPLQLVSKRSETLTSIAPHSDSFADAGPPSQHLPTSLPPTMQPRQQNLSPFAMAASPSNRSHMGQHSTHPQRSYHGKLPLHAQPVQHAQHTQLGQHSSLWQPPQNGSQVRRPVSAPIPSLQRSPICGQAKASGVATPLGEWERGRRSDMERHSKLEAALQAQMIMQRKLHDQLEVSSPQNCGCRV